MSALSYHDSFLFSFFPREVAISDNDSFLRKEIYSIRSFSKHVRIALYKFADCYTSVYNTTTNIWVDKLSFDFDAKEDESLRDVFEVVSEFVRELLRKWRLQFIWCFSGRRGFHIHILLNPTFLNPPLARLTVREAQMSFVNGFDFVDSHLIGNIRGLIRVPNTFNRRGRFFCIPLPEDAVDWRIGEIFRYSKKQQRVRVLGERRMSILDFISSDVRGYVREREDCSDFRIEMDESVAPPLSVLRDFLHPCVFKHIQDENPEHYIRFAFVAELLYAGFSVEEIERVIKTFRWRDYDEEVTRYQVRHIARGNYRPPSCSNLSKIVNCKEVCGRRW